MTHEHNTDTLNNTAAPDLRYITAEEYKVLRGIFDRFGIDDLEWCSDAIYGLTCSSFREFFKTQPAIITHLNKTAAKDNSRIIECYIRSLTNVNEHLSEVVDCYQMLRNIACISKAIGDTAKSVLL